MYSDVMHLKILFEDGVETMSTNLNSKSFCKLSLLFDDDQCAQPAARFPHVIMLWLSAAWIVFQQCMTTQTHWTGTLSVYHTLSEASAAFPLLIFPIAKKN